MASGVLFGAIFGFMTYWIAVRKYQTI